MINAFNIVKNELKDSNTHLVIMGVDFGYQDEMEKLIKSVGREPRQRTTSYGHVSELQRQKSLGASDLAEPVYASAEKYERKLSRKKPKLVRPGIDNLGGEEKITSADIV